MKHDDDLRYLCISHRQHTQTQQTNAALNYRGYDLADLEDAVQACRLELTYVRSNVLAACNHTFRSLQHA